MLFCRAATVSGWITLIGLWDDERPPGSRGREYAVLANEVEAGRGNERSELSHQFQGFKDDVGGSVAPAVLEAIEQPAVGQDRQPEKAAQKSSPCELFD